MRITSAQNPRIKAAAKLREHGARRQQGRLLVDGRREIAAAVVGGWKPLEVFYRAEGCQDAAGQALLASLQQRGAAAFEVPAAVLGKLAYGQRDEGVVAVFAARKRELNELPLHDNSLLVVLEGVEKPGNLGAVLRTADAVGANGVIVVGGTDVENPNTIRASLGAAFAVPTCAAGAEQAVEWLRQHRVRMLAARVDAPLNYVQADYRGAVAIILGSESDGLSAVWQQEDICGIHLPLRGRVDSLNVSVTAAVLLYEALRQRGIDSV